MVIPKEFEGLSDLEAMLLTSILGTFQALRDDLISFQQAENYWISSFTAELFESLQLSRELVDLMNEALTLKDLKEFTSLYNDKLDELLAETKMLMSKYYTEYESSEPLPQAIN